MKALAIATLAQIASAAACQRYAAVDMSPAGRALVPRFLIDAPQLAVRDGGICNPNYHSCVDIGYPETCCANSNYCYVRPDNQPWCCPVGSNCDSNCAATAYQCPTTVTRTVSETVTGGAIITTSVSSACCGRTCPSTSAFRCESRFGGGCCSYGQTCVSGGGCVRTVTPTTSATALLTPIDPGCTATTQHACADGGCCDRLWDCVVVSGTAACAPGRPTATDVRIVDDSPDELSTGAKAGIGVGVSIVGCTLVVLSAWFCLFRRRRQGTATASSSRRSGGAGASRVSGGVSGPGSERPGRSARAMSEVTSSSRPTMWRGGTQDYFGPDAMAGPYTETETVSSDRVAVTSPGRGRGVPLQAYSPSDVVAPVEMDSVGVMAEAEAEVKAAQESYELYGSEVASPSAGKSSPPTQGTPGSIVGVSTMDRPPGSRARGENSA